MNMNATATDFAAMIQAPVFYTLTSELIFTSEKPHVCPVKTCGKSFSTSGNLSRHKRLHGYIEPLQCPVDGCVCAFPSNNKLAKHMKFHFGNEDVKVCAVVGCGKTFSTTGNLNRHMKTMHEDVDTNTYAVHNVSACSSPARTATSSAAFSGSPTAADQWIPEVSFADAEFEAIWTCAPISLAESAAEDPCWGSDLEDVLAVLFDDSEDF